MKTRPRRQAISLPESSDNAGEYTEQSKKRLRALVEEGLASGPGRPDTEADERELRAIARGEIESCAVTDDCYVSSAVLDEALERGRSCKRERLAAADMVSIAEAAAIARQGIENIEAAVATGALLGLEDGSGNLRLPRWQFEAVYAGIWKQLADALGSRDPWELLTAMETPHGALGGLTLRVAIERGQRERALAVAGYD